MYWIYFQQLILSLIPLSFVQALGIFGLCQIHAFVDYLRYRLTPSYFEILFKSLIIISATVAGIIGAILTITGKVCINFLCLLCTLYAV